MDTVAARCTEVESGARNVDNILTKTLLPEVSQMLLASLAEGRKPGRIEVRVEDRGAFGYDMA